VCGGVGGTREVGCGVSRAEAERKAGNLFYLEGRASPGMSLLLCLNVEVHTWSIDAVWSPTVPWEGCEKTYVHVTPATVEVSGGGQDCTPSSAAHRHGAGLGDRQEPGF
jgi:hypothetical protein